jgi:hypothetical protein
MYLMKMWRHNYCLKPKMVEHRPHKKALNLGTQKRTTSASKPTTVNYAHLFRQSYLPAGSSYPVHVVLGCVREVVVDYELDVGDVDAAGSHVCCDQNGRATAPVEERRRVLG